MVNSRSRCVSRGSQSLLMILILGGCSHFSIPFMDSTPEVVDFSQLSEAQKKHYELSLNYIQSNHYSVAEGKLLSLIEEYPTYPDAYNALGVVYERRGRVTVASEAFLQAITLKPDYDTAIENYSRLMCFVSGGEGIVDASSSVEQGQVKSILYTAASRCYISKNEYEKARSVVEYAIDNNPNYALNYLYLAQIELNDLDYIAAKNAIDQFNDLNGYTKESAGIGLLISQNLGDQSEVEKYQSVLNTQF